jgi:TonB-dependent starch-binding outer membrane protein SusC
MTKLYLLFRRFIMALLMFGTIAAFAQQRVTGKVTASDDGSPIPGVNILEKGTSNGTASDAAGNYSISVAENATLVFTFVGYMTQEYAVSGRSTLNVTMQSDVTSLSEVVVTGYGTQEKKEITSAVVSLDSKDFNIGNINDPSQLLQGKVPGLSVYNRGGDPNSSSVIRLRGISTVGANTQPLIVIDGVIGASLDNVDPNDIESVSVLKDGSAAAIYGSRASSGVIIVTTKRGSRRGGVTVDYNGYVSAATILNEQPVMTPSQYLAAGGNDLGSATDWQKEVTQTGMSYVNNVSITGGSEKTTYRMSANFRNIDGILKKSGFDQINTRANLNHRALDDKLQVDLNMSLTDRRSDFSFNEALRYAVLYNPTAPVKFDNGGFYQAILFDNFNPVAILEQNINEGKRKTLNYNAKIDYSIVDEFTVTANFGQQFESVLNGEYYSRESFFRGLNRGGLARRYTSDRTFTLFETYGTYSKQLSNVTLDATIGYSYQEDQFEDFFIELGNFPSDALGYYALENAGDRISGLGSLVNINSSRSPNNKIGAVFARVNLNFNDKFFFNASVRREGSSKLGENNRFGLFPAVGAGIDITKFLSMESFDTFKFRVGYGVTGALPAQSGLSRDLYTYNFDGGGSVRKARDANPDLKWEEKAEINLGLDFGIGGKISGALDVYNRRIRDFILERDVDVAVYSSGRRTENVGELSTNGIELALTYNSVNIGQVRWTPGIVLSNYATKLDKYITDEEMRANLGSPGQNGTNMIRVKEGERIGQIWGPVFDGVNPNGSPRFKDINGDGTIISNPQDALNPNADFKVLGNGLPTMEFGWTNQVTYKRWDFNVFFRGAFGHSLVNNFRAFYEPIDPGAINSYNRIITEKAVDGLQFAQFSSLYVEKADFVKLDNLTIGYKFATSQSNVFRNVRVYGNVQNLFVLTNYSGIDPEPVLQDFGSSDNGGFLGTTPDVLSPGIDRRNNYFTSRTFTFGINIGF